MTRGGDNDDPTVSGSQNRHPQECKNERTSFQGSSPWIWQSLEVVALAAESWAEVSERWKWMEMEGS